MFQIALDPVPNRRDLTAILDLLGSRLTWRDWAQVAARRADQAVQHLTTGAGAVATAANLPDHSSSLPGPLPTLVSTTSLGFFSLQNVDLPITSVGLHPRITSLTVNAFAILSKTLTEHYRSLTDSEVELLRSATWAYCTYALLGVGCEASTEDALGLLDDSVIASAGAKIWKGACALLPLCIAKGHQIPHSHFEQICQITNEVVLDCPFIRNRLSTFVQYENGSLVAKALFGSDELPDTTFFRLFQPGTDAREREQRSPRTDQPTAKNLHTLVISGNLEQLRELARAPVVDINAISEHGDTALLLACRHGRHDAVLCLLDAGADAALENNRGENGLHWLSSFPAEEMTEIATLLRRGGARLYPTDSETALRPPDFDEDEFVMHGLVPGSPILRAVSFDNGHSFQVLCELMMEDARKGLIAPWFLMELCYQPLCLAFRLHVAGVAEGILKFMVNVLPSFFSEDIGEANDTLAYWMVEVKCGLLFWDVLTIEHSLARMTLHGPKWRTAQQRCLQLLMDYKIYVPVPDYPKAGVGLITSCLLQKNDDALEFILTKTEFRKNVNDVDGVFNHCTPIDIALDGHRKGAFKLLVDAGAILDLRNMSDPEHRLAEVGASYLHVCATSRHESVEYAKTILAHGVPASITDNRGLPALFNAVLRADFDLAHLLIEHGADVNSEIALGYTMLGCLLDTGFDWQCDDQVESVR